MSIEIRCCIVAAEDRSEKTYELDERYRDIPTFVESDKRFCQVEFTLRTEGVPPGRLGVDDLVALISRRCTLVVEDGEPIR